MSLARILPAFLRGGAAPEPPPPPPEPTGDSYSLMRTLDRSFGTTPASGGGNLQPQTFEHDDDTWQVWQVIPFLGNTVVSGDRIGDCRVQLRDTSIGRNQMQLADMPDRVTIESDVFNGTPWEFTRPTSNAKFSSPGSGNNARRAIDYEPVHSPAASPSAAGIAQGETFTVTLHFD